MRRAPHKFLPPRQLVIYAITRRMLDETAANINKFSMTVAEYYFAMTALDQRHVKFRWGESVDELCKAERHNSQVLGRYMKGEVKVLPADLEDAWICALSEPYRSEAERELASRRGHLAVQLPTADKSTPVASIASMTHEFSELLGALASALHDGVINEADRPLLRRVIAEGDDLIAAVLSVRLQALAQLERPAQETLRGR
jgi:hypothetical protein